MPIAPTREEQMSTPPNRSVSSSSLSDLINNYRNQVRDLEAEKKLLLQSSEIPIERKFQMMKEYNAQIKEYLNKIELYNTSNINIPNGNTIRSSSLKIS